jgi:hypothetical protein
MFVPFVLISVQIGPVINEFRPQSCQYYFWLLMQMENISNQKKHNVVLVNATVTNQLS